jgi:GntR family transcriptional regulator
MTMTSSPLDRGSGVPLYRQIKQILLAEIREGLGADGQSMTEDVLIQRFGVSRAPIRQALKELVDDGYVYRERARGTFPVHGLDVKRPAALQLEGLMEYLREKGRSPVSEVSDINRVKPPTEVRERLRLNLDDTVLTFARVISVEDERIVSSRVYLSSPQEFHPTQSEVEDASSAFALLEHALTRSEHHVWATAATASDAADLGLPEGAPVLVVETTLFTREGRPGGWRRSVHRSNEFKYVFTSNR